MLPLLGAALGFASSVVPQVIKFFQDKRDKEHELKLLDKQIQMQAAGHLQRLEEINVQADVGESKALYKYAIPQQAKPTGVVWIDGLAAVLFSLTTTLISSVRPVVTYGIVGLYAWVKVVSFQMIEEPTIADLQALWTETDETIMMVVLGHWFGNRVMQRFFGK